MQRDTAHEMVLEVGSNELPLTAKWVLRSVKIWCKMEHFSVKAWAVVCQNEDFLGIPLRAAYCLRIWSHGMSPEGFVSGAVASPGPANIQTERNAKKGGISHR